MAQREKWVVTQIRKGAQPIWRVVRAGRTVGPIYPNRSQAQGAYHTMMGAGRRMKRFPRPVLRGGRGRVNKAAGSLRKVRRSGYSGQNLGRTDH